MTLLSSTASQRSFRPLSEILIFKYIDFHYVFESPIVSVPSRDPYIQIQEKDHRFVQLCFRPLSEILIFKFTQREVSELAKDVFPSPLGDPYIQMTAN